MYGILDLDKNFTKPEIIDHQLILSIEFLLPVLIALLISHFPINEFLFYRNFWLMCLNIFEYFQLYHDEQGRKINDRD
jgi:hypothetical protein